VRTIEVDAFAGSELHTLVIPKSVITIKESADTILSHYHLYRIASNGTLVMPERLAKQFPLNKRLSGLEATSENGVVRFKPNA
jgi:hypothetical protein